MIRRAGLSFALVTFSVALPLHAEEPPAIVVTGQSLKQTEANLAACLARKCPPDQDVRATLAHAENQFVAGKYKDARATLLKSVGRNRRHGDAFPVPVSDLLRANARIAAHLGEAGDFQSSTIASRDILKSGVGAEDPRTLVGNIEVADMRARLGFPDEATRMYRSIGERARALNLPYIAAAVELRGALLLLASDAVDEKKEGRQRLTEIAQSEDPMTRTARLAAKVMLARLDRKAGSDAATKTLIAEYAAKGGTNQPTLISADPIKQPAVAYSESDNRNTLSQMATKNFDGQWFDVGFWITPEGRPSDIEVLRSSGSDTFWTKPVLESIKTRVYAPLNRDPGDQGIYAVERYTLTSYWEERLGTRMRQRSAIPRIERMDLTAEQIATTTPTTGSR